MFVVLQEEKVDSSLEFLILASDGLWDVVSNEVGNDVHFFPFPVDNYSVHFHHKPRKYKRVKTYQELLGCSFTHF